MADDTLTPELKKKLDETLGKTGLTDKAILTKAEEAADKVIPQIETYAAAVQALNDFAKKPASRTPDGMAQSMKLNQEMISKGQNLQMEEGKVLQKMGVEASAVSRIESATLLMARDQAATIVAKGANGQKR